MPRLIASDVDGTLLDPQERVTPRTAATVAAVRGCGVPFVLVSGRPPRWIPQVARAAGVGGYAVCANGAVLYDIDADRVIRTHILQPVELSEIAHALDIAMPGCSVAVERIVESARAIAAGTFLTEKGFSDLWPGPIRLTAPRAEVLGRPATKLMVRHADLSSDEMAQIAHMALDGAAGVTFSGSVGTIEISAPGVTKGTGLAEVAERLSTTAADVVAFGDMPNDIPMLRWAGHGVAMANAHDRVLAVADEVTATNAEDGVAALLDRWF